MLREMSAQQFIKWMAYDQLEPIGERRGDYRAASIVATLANINRDAKKHPKPYTIEEFLLNYDASEKPRRRQTAAEQDAVLLAWAIGASGGTR